MQFKPIKIIDVELSKKLVAIDGFDGERHQYYERVRALVRLHGEPLGLINIDLPNRKPLSPDEYITIFWERLHKNINVHLQRDGMPEIIRLTADGLNESQKPRCQIMRENLSKNGPLVSVVICTRDRTDQLARCLNSVLNLEYTNYEIIIVDNAPKTTDTLNLIKDKYSHIRYLRYVSEPRPGLSWARNRGINSAEGEIVTFIDDDVHVDRSWLVNLVKGFSMSMDVAAVTGPVLAAELETPAQVWFDQRFSPYIDFVTRIFDLKEHKVSHPLYPYLAVYGIGANMSFRRKILRELGGFDPVLGSGTPACGGEDFDMFVRLVRAGYNILFIPSAINFHYHMRSYKNLKRKMHAYGVGLAAFLTKCMVNEPGFLFFALSRIKPAYQHLIDPTSRINSRKTKDYPVELNLLERMGMAKGPIAYLQSYLLTKHLIRRFGPISLWPDDR